MNRISTNNPNDNMQFHLRERNRSLQHLQNQIATQSRIQNLRDDPMAAAHSTRYQSYTARLQRYGDNIETIMARNQSAEGYLQHGTDMIQRARELAVQGANGIYTREDMQHMAVEIDEIIKEMVEVANARSSDGTAIFAGDRTRSVPFHPLQGSVAAGEDARITEVLYRGTIGQQSGEVGENSFIETNFPGNKVFWAENQQVSSRVDARDYLVEEHGSFSINGVEIPLREGDTVHSLINRINDSGAPVRARLDPVFSGLVLETTTPQQLWLQEGPGSPVLQDLGLVSSSDDPPPRNIARDAMVSGGSVFDALIRLRDMLHAGDQDAIGSQGINGMDRALDALTGSLGRIGAVNSRLDGSWMRNENEILNVKNQNSQKTDVDLAEAIMELRKLEATHRAALSVSARIMQPTLLDFIR